MLLKKIQNGTGGGIKMPANPTYQLVCGMEIHAELKTKSKMFCGCKNDPFHAPEPNCYTCPVCLGLPGALPVANAKAIEWTVKLGLALGCKINLYSKFDRKHYFYPDLPKGYQISQYDLPFCVDGTVETTEGRVRIRRIHLEEDTGKLLHKTVDGEKLSLIDFNRSSVPLVEIVTEPDIKTATQASEYAKKIRSILRSLDIADCDMEQGGMRLEANVSVRPSDTTDLPAYKVELKNINSFKFLEQGISYEIDRQSKALSKGEVIPQETRGYNATTCETFIQRSKEDAEDYRYFPDPDLPPIRFTTAQIEQWRAELPELPEHITKRWKAAYDIEPRFTKELLKNPERIGILDQLFAQATTQSIDNNKLAASLVNKRIALPTTADETPLVLQQFADQQKTTTVGNELLSSAITKVLQKNPDVVEKYRAGQKQVISFVMGQVMREVGKADAQQVRAAIEKALSS